MNAAKPKIVVIGASGHGKVVIDIVEREGKYAIAGLVDAQKERGSACSGYPVLGNESCIPEILREGIAEAGIIAIGDNWVRHGVARRIAGLAPDFRFVSAVHPAAQLGRNAAIGGGSVVMAGAVVNSDSVVGEFCIVNTNSSLDHDTVLGDYACVMPGATVGGNVRIGRFSVVALGASVIHGVRIGEHTVVGAGATVLSDLPDCVVAWGTPARVVRSRNPGDRYL